jgi:hypothetical protein
MSTTQDIHGALLARLLTVTSLPAVAHEGVPYRPTTGTAYVVPTLVVSARRPDNVAASASRIVGSFEVSVVYPSGEGTGAVNAMADAIVEKFLPPLDLYQGSLAVRVRYAERRGAATIDANWLRLHVSIGWRTHV